MSGELWAILLFAVLGVCWFDSMRAREAALAIAQRAVDNADCQLLDATVSLNALRLARDDEGVPRLHRVYRFEFSDDGTRRLPGTVTLLGRTLLRVEMAPHREMPPTWTVVRGGRDDPPAGGMH
jgi:hypothetical protein